MVAEINYSKYRRQFVDWVKLQLTGPAAGKQEYLNGIHPLDWYAAGILFPVIEGGTGVDPADLDDDSSSSGMDGSLENEDSEDDSIAAKPTTEPKKQIRYTPPSSVGFSFFVKGDVADFQVQYSAVQYEDARQAENSAISWRRIVLADDLDNTLNFSLSGRVSAFSSRDQSLGTGNIKNRETVLEGHGIIDILCRPVLCGWIITVTLSNAARITFENSLGKSNAVNGAKWNTKKNANALFEARLSCTIDQGVVGIYPGHDFALLSREEQELELRYRHHHIYAIGHGAAVDWVFDQDQGHIRELMTDFMPAVEVPLVTAQSQELSLEALTLVNLSQCTEHLEKTIAHLNQFTCEYEAWIKARQGEINDFTGQEQKSAQRIVQRMNHALARMKKGVNLIARDTSVARAFGIANQAMLSQMAQGVKVQGKTIFAKTFQWRPFQLAFILMALESATDEDAPDRDLVDLIWFPTGGGKTEAYLGLTAFVIALRRLAYPASGNGTSVIMRYTLRLLTSQQFIRACRLICALELIRRSCPDMGKEPVTIGMWVGRATTPNTLQQVREFIETSAKDGATQCGELVLTACPWCGTPFKFPDNYHIGPKGFQFRCTNLECEYGKNGPVPCQVVDEALYEQPPTFLVATIDKFARLAWDPRTNAFFGKGINRPPELIIQDELHLISGALGSIAGLYEAGLDTLLVSLGGRPKYVASTATIRMARDQVARLYGKSVAIFPPPGLDCDDSFFARTVPLDVRPGRLYLGYLAPGVNHRQSLIPLAATLMAAPEILFGNDQINEKELLEAWWTLVGYHGSLKGVGNSHNLFTSQIAQRLKIIKDDALKSGIKIERELTRIVQLTSISTARENAQTFARLELPRSREGCIDAALATNMISVGLDVGRLALMVINGQPLTVAEYIQASSRVGRSVVPGMVFINYYRDQARSLSHYENFRPFHESFYRFVEPTSITPFAFQARERALHAALIIALRHGCPGLLSNSRAGAFDLGFPGVGKIIEKFKLRCALADRDREREICRHIDRLVRKWHEKAAQCKMAKRDLVYADASWDNNADRLMYIHGQGIEGVWPTLNSMRNVEANALLKPV